MGVLACDRKGCESIMCDNVSHEFGYICSECKSELINLQGTVSIQAFLRSDKEVEAFEGWEEYINEVFTSRYEEDE